MTDLPKRWPWFRAPHKLLIDNRKYFRRFDTNLPLQDYGFVVLDTELTGLNRKKDEIISIGAVRVKNLQIDLGETFHYYIKPRNIDYTEATLVHRITPEQLKKAPSLAEVVPKFISFIGTDLLVGHFVSLDMGFLNRATEEVFNGTLANPYIDTMMMAQAYKRVMRGYYHQRNGTDDSCNLQDLSREFNLPFFEAHDALEDAMQTAYLFLYLVKKFKSGDMITLKDLYRAGRSRSRVL